MSRDRRLALTKPEQGPNGRNRCRWCQTEVTGRRQTFCSDPCVHEWRLRSHSGYVRSLLFERDRGICAECGRDCEATREAYRTWMQGRYGRWLYAHWPEQLAWLAFHGIPLGRVHSEWWDADHITPVVEGGGLCGLENYRTLCIPCHKLATRALARRRAEQRREVVSA